MPGTGIKSKDNDRVIKGAPFRGLALEGCGEVSLGCDQNDVVSVRKTLPIYNIESQRLSGVRPRNRRTSERS